MSLWTQFIFRELVDHNLVQLTDYYKTVAFAFRMYALQEIISVEHVPDPLTGDRFLLELRLIDKQTWGSVLLSEHVYTSLADDSKLCYPEGFQWNKSATVNIIVPVKNSGRWALYLIKNIAGNVLVASFNLCNDVLNSRHGVCAHFFSQMFVTGNLYQSSLNSTIQTSYLFTMKDLMLCYLRLENSVCYCEEFL